jgi:hypothetical protein
MTHAVWQQGLAKFAAARGAGVSAAAAQGNRRSSSGGSSGGSGKGKAR